MPLPPVALINGYRVSHASFKVRLFGLLVPGVKELNWKVSVEKGEVRGTAREKLASTIGDAKYESSLTVFRAEWDAIKERIRTTYGVAPMDIQGDLVYQYAEKGFPSKTVQVRVNGITEADTSSSAGVDATEVKLTFDVPTIFEDGKSMIENSIYA